MSAQKKVLIDKDEDERLDYITLLRFGENTFVHKNTGQLIMDIGLECFRIIEESEHGESFKNDLPKKTFSFSVDDDEYDPHSDLGYERRGR